MSENRDILLKRMEHLTGYKFMRGPFYRSLKNIFPPHIVDRSTNYISTFMPFNPQLLWTWQNDMTTIGLAMEETTDLLKAANEQAVESRRYLQDIANQVKAMSEQIRPALAAYIEEIRSNRMTVTTETEKTLTQLREVRKFFFEDNYEKEMDRLERFIRCCRELGQLKRDGILDAVADIAIRLAVKEESQP